MKRWMALLPVMLFAGLAGLFIQRLERPDKEVRPSPLIGKAYPATLLGDMDGRAGGLAAHHFADGKPVMVNFFASWCPPCQAEHPQLMQLKAAGVRMYGIAVKDRPVDTTRFLDQNGNPYARIGADRDGRVARTWGVYGYPESYLLDGNGIIRFRQAGDIRAEQVAQIVKTMHALEQPR